MLIFLFAYAMVVDALFIFNFFPKLQAKNEINSAVSCCSPPIFPVDLMMPFDMLDESQIMKFSISYCGI